MNNSFFAYHLSCKFISKYRDKMDYIIFSNSKNTVNNIKLYNVSSKKELNTTVNSSKLGFAFNFDVNKEFLKMMWISIRKLISFSDLIKNKNKFT